MFRMLRIVYCCSFYAEKLVRGENHTHYPTFFFQIVQNANTAGCPRWQSTSWAQPAVAVSDMVNDSTVLAAISCLCVLHREPGLDTSIHSPGADSHISCCSSPVLKVQWPLALWEHVRVCSPVTESVCCQRKGIYG